MASDHEEVLPEDVIKKDKFVICLGGKYGVGKSTIFRILMSEYCGVMRDGLCRETDTDYCVFDVKVDGQTCEILLKDTASLERFSSVPTRSYFRTIDALVLVYKYSHLDQSSIFALKDWIQMMMASRQDDHRVVYALWGNVFEEFSVEPDEFSLQVLAGISELYNIPSCLQHVFNVTLDKAKIIEAFKILLKCLCEKRRAGTLGTRTRGISLDEEDINVKNNKCCS